MARSLNKLTDTECGASRGCWAIAAGYISTSDRRVEIVALYLETRRKRGKWGWGRIRQ